MTDTITFELEYLDSCPICTSASLMPAIRAEWKGNEITYVLCTDCGQLFLNPRMTDEQTTLYYSGTYRDLTEGTGSGISNSNLYTQCKRAETQYRAMFPYLQEIGSHLELGCSAGYLLDEVKAKKSMGVEPDTRYHALPIASLYPMASDLALVPPMQYDLISMSHVLEHFNHPLQVLQNLVFNYAGPNTKFLIEVPNSEYQVVATLSHPMSFSLVTLSRLFERVGYKPMAVTYHGMGRPFPAYLLAMFEQDTP